MARADRDFKLRESGTLTLSEIPAGLHHPADCCQDA
jgi:hypothetical protein